MPDEHKMPRWTTNTLGTTENADKLAAIVAFCLSHGMTETDLRVRYPEVVSFAR